jgi:hypothetical protein
LIAYKAAFSRLPDRPIVPEKDKSDLAIGTIAALPGLERGSSTGPGFDLTIPIQIYVKGGEEGENGFDVTKNDQYPLPTMR